jgi:ferritin-like metal-binding protein YciE
MPITTPREKFVHALSVLYGAENQFLQAQQQMLDQTSDEELKGLLHAHIGESQEQVENLERVFSQMGQQPQRQTSEAARGLISDAQRSLQEAQVEAIRDTLIAEAQAKVEHFEIACYRALIAGAMQMELGDEVVGLLEQNLQQEEHTAQMIEESTPQLVHKSMQAA